MDANTPLHLPSQFGHVTIHSQSGLPEDVVAERDIPGMVRPTHFGSWRPCTELAKELPQGFELSFRCLTAPDGSRRLLPASCREQFILEASLAGFAILARIRGLSAEQRSSYNVMRLVFQHAPRLREHLERGFAREADLRVPRPEQAGLGQDILPVTLGLDGQRRGARWTVAELLEQGRAAAVAAGNRSPDTAHCIAAGLLAAARLDPLDPRSLSETEARQLVRLALFDLGPALEAVDEPRRQAVIARLLAALERHIGDDTEKFDGWFFEGRDDLIHQIAKQRKRGSPIDRAIVRAVLVDLVSDAYSYVGDCVCLLMQDFLRGLPAPLQPDERILFEALFFKQAYLGGLPLIILRERFGFLREAIPELLEDPRDDRQWGVLLRLLQFYGEMSSRRREVDRAYKRRALQRNERGQVARLHRLASQSPTATDKTSTNRTFQAIAARLIVARGIKCACGAGVKAWMARLVDDEDRFEVQIEIECRECGYTERMDVARTEFERIGREVLGDDQRPGPGASNQIEQR